ncbi:MAG: CHAT domain-containing protein [Streptosporangiaceae bacterium]
MSEAGMQESDLVRLITMKINGGSKQVRKEDCGQFGEARGRIARDDYECAFKWDGRTEQTVTLLADLLRNAAAYGTLPDDSPFNSATVDQIAHVLGYHLYDLLFGDEKTNALLQEALKSYREKRLRFVRVELEFVGGDENAMTALPWEYVRIPPERDGPKYLAHTSQLVLNRRLHLSDMEPPELMTEDALKVLVVAASPVLPEPGKENPLAPVSAAVVTGKLNSLKSTLGERLLISTLEDAQLEGGRPDSSYKPNVTRGRLGAKIQRDQPHVVHFIGHGRRGTDQRGQLALSGEDSRPDWIDDEDFADLVCGQNRDLRLVILQACESALPSRYMAGASGVASQVALRGIPAVVAMQYSINATAANTFAAGFYGAVLGETAVPVDIAVSMARQQMLSFGGEAARSSVSFPVVYLLDYHRLMGEPKSAPPVGAPIPSKTPVPPQSFTCPRKGCGNLVRSDDIRCSRCALLFVCHICGGRWDPMGSYCNKCKEVTYVKQELWPRTAQPNRDDATELIEASSFGAARTGAPI